MTEAVDVVIDNSSKLVIGGDLHGESVSVDHIEGFVHVIDGQSYQCKTMSDGNKVLVYITNPVEDYFLTTASFF